MDLDEPMRPGFFRKEVDSHASCLEVPHLEVIMESSHSVSGWSTRCTFLKALTQGLLFSRKVDSIESFLSILRILDHAEAIRPDEATIALFQLIKGYNGDKAEVLVEALLDVGADVYHPDGPVRKATWKPYSEGAFDVLSLSAIYGRESVVSYLLWRHQSHPRMFTAAAYAQCGIRLTTKKASKRLGGLAQPPRDWFCRKSFQAMRSLHGSDVDAVLACLYNVSPILREAALHSTECPLSVAIQREDAEAVRKLLLLGANAQAKDEGYCRLKPLHKAIEKGHAPIVHLLLQANASVKTRMRVIPFSQAVWEQFNYLNATPLHLAVWKGDPSIVQALLDHGANIHARTGSDKAETPRCQMDTAGDCTLLGQIRGYQQSS
ncbi:ankyrin repeat-containing domain protein [Coprinopsis sp. MPI-PUGE-AT-0042]|nr:ankyrin repeat-containing domain protein [Coprinopsis sp. MPI-PUGE-AT-0042]